MSTSAGVHQPSGDGEDLVLQGGDGGLFEVASGEASDGAGEVVGHDRECEPGGVGHELPGGQVREAGGLELGDPLLHHRVPAVVGLDLEDVAGPKGG